MRPGRSPARSPTPPRARRRGFATVRRAAPAPMMGTAVRVVVIDDPLHPVNPEFQPVTGRAAPTADRRHTRLLVGGLRDNGWMQLYRDDGVVLRPQKLGEADRIVTVLPRKTGRGRALAQRGRPPQPPLRGPPR